MHYKVVPVYFEGYNDGYFRTVSDIEVCESIIIYRMREAFITKCIDD